MRRVQVPKNSSADQLLSDWQIAGYGKRLANRDRQCLEVRIQAALRQAEAKGIMRALDVTCCGHWKCPEVGQTRDLARRIEVGLPLQSPEVSDG